MPSKPRFWKRAFLSALSFGVGVAGGLALLMGGIAGYDSYQDRAMPPRPWTALEMPSIGLRASLMTQWREREIKYIFRVAPLDPTLAEAFNNIATGTVASASAFTVFLRDSTGFNLCEIQVWGLTREVNDKGLAEALVANGNTPGCSPDKYRESETWTVSYRFPMLVAERSQGLRWPEDREVPTATPPRIR
jgi:hypothetical protein